MRRSLSKSLCESLLISHQRLLLSFLLLFCFSTLGASKLRLVQLVYRHGDRTPSHTFPNDPYRDMWFSEGEEMLTKLGMVEHYQLGQYFRRRYGTFLRAHYFFNDTRIRSTDNDRAVQSAQAQLLGLYNSPQGKGFPLPQIVPIHTVPKKYDQLLKMTSPCPAYTRLWEEMMQSDLWKLIEAKHREFFDYLAKSTGLERVGLNTAFNIADPVVVWIAHNLTLPSWLTPEVTHRLLIIKNLKQYLRYYTKRMQRLRGGPMVSEMIENMRNKLSGSDLCRRRLLYGYSAHDSTVAAISSYMDVFNNIQPPYASCIIVELHQIGSSAENPDDHIVRLYYRNDSTREPWRLTLPKCKFDCPLTEFIRLNSGNLPTDIRKECFDEEIIHFGSNVPVSIRAHAWSLFISTVMALAVLAFLCTLYKKYL